MSATGPRVRRSRRRLLLPAARGVRGAGRAVPAGDARLLCGHRDHPGLRPARRPISKPPVPVTAVRLERGYPQLAHEEEDRIAHHR